MLTSAWVSPSLVVCHECGRAAGSLHLCFSRSFTPPDHVAFRCWGLQVSSSELMELEVPGSAWTGAAHTSHRNPAPRDPGLPPSSNLAATARRASPEAARAQQRAAGAPCIWARGSPSKCGSRCGRLGSPARSSVPAGAAPPRLPAGAAHEPALAARRHQVIPQEASAIGQRSALDLHVNGLAWRAPGGRKTRSAQALSPKSSKSSWC